MENAINNLGELYYPLAMLIFYEGEKHKQSYVEHFTFDKSGMPCNAHPLTVREAGRLRKALTKDANHNYLTQKLFGTQILSFNPIDSKVIWYTKPQIRDLHFSGSLGIKDGSAHVPPMLWVADRKKLNVYALNINRRPTLNTVIYHAPFFNLYENGNVCLGTVDVDQDSTETVEQFMTKWEQYFFNSNFSHLLQGHNPINGNCVLLWENLITTGEKFPLKTLRKTRFKLKDLL